MKKRVLIIEDSNDIGNALKQLIEFEGYEAMLADRAFKAREMAASSCPDLIIVDIRLPDEDGLKLTRELRASPETADTPIICVSSYIDGLHEEALLAGCNEVFSKTTFMQSFRETLQKYLQAEYGIRSDRKIELIPEGSLRPTAIQVSISERSE
jgi:CheY-like chemotaxis protein